MTWTDATTSLDDAYGGCWADDLAEFLGVGQDAGLTKAVIGSADGVTWADRPSPFDGGVGRAVVRDAFLGLYVAVGLGPGGTDAVITSPDGTTWTGRGNPLSNQIECIACKQSNGVVNIGAGAASGSPTTALAASPDGITFTPAASAFDGGNVAGIDYSPSQDLWVAAGVDSNRNPYLAYSSDDGATWTSLALGVIPAQCLQPPRIFRDEAGGRWWLLGQTVSGFSLAYAIDGLGLSTWAEVSTPLDPGGSGVGAAFAMVDAGGTLTLTGRDSSGGGNQMCLMTSEGNTPDAWVLDDVDPDPFGPGYGRALAYSMPLTLGVAFAAADGDL